LRKAIVRKESAIIRYKTIDGFEGELLINNGELSFESHRMRLLTFLSKPMEKVEWDDATVNINTCPAEESIHYAINHITWEAEESRTICTMFAKLPAVRMMKKSVHFDNFLVNISNDILLQMSDSDKGCIPALFLLQEETKNSLQPYRMKAFLFNYLLGYIQSSKVLPLKSEQDHGHQPKRSGFLQRIIKRIRGIS